MCKEVTSEVKYLTTQGGRGGGFERYHYMYVHTCWKGRWFEKRTNEFDHPDKKSTYIHMCECAFNSCNLVFKKKLKEKNKAEDMLLGVDVGFCFTTKNKHNKNNNNGKNNKPAGFCNA